MPKAAINENHGAVLGKYEIWCAREIPRVQAVSETHGMQCAPEIHLELSVFGFHAPHSAVPLFERKVVGHFPMPRRGKLDGCASCR